MKLLHTLHRPAGDGPFPTVLALHGWGASAHDLLGLAPLFPGRCLTLCPQGTVTVPIGPGQEGHGWFPLNPGQPTDREAFLAAAGDLRAFFEHARRHYPVGDRVVPLGFSQGGIMGLDMVLRDPGSFAGLVVLSSWYPKALDDDLPHLAAHQGFPVLMIHGSEDQLVPPEKARESKERLAARGVALTYQEFPMAHEIRPEALRVILKWLGERLG